MILRCVCIPLFVLTCALPLFSLEANEKTSKETKKKPNPNAIEASILFLNPSNYTCALQVGTYSSVASFAAGTRITSQGKPIDFTDLKVGQKVLVSTTQNDQQLVIGSLEVIDPPVTRTSPPPKPVLTTVKGIINSYDPFAQRLSITAGGNTYFVNISDLTQYEPEEMEKNRRQSAQRKESAGAKDLKPGARVTVKLQQFGPGRREIASINLD
jgi:hypothetical protein